MSGLGHAVLDALAASPVADRLTLADEDLLQRTADKVTRAVADQLDAAEVRVRAEERHRIAWWLRQAAGGPVGSDVEFTEAHRQACRELADVIEHHPDRFALAPAYPRGATRG